LNQPYLRIHVNLEENLRGILAYIDRDPEKIVRVGTGEFADSLALDPLTQLDRCPDAALSPKGRIPSLEFKTKTDRIEGLIASPYRDRIIVSWSLNSPAHFGNGRKGGRYPEAKA
jgi:spore photoproduct lyase